MEMGAQMDDLLKYASQQLTACNSPSKTTMLNLVSEQHREVAQRAIPDKYRQLVLPDTNIHVVDLSDAFRWDGSLARQRLNMIGDLVRCALDCRTLSFDAFLDAQIAYFSRCHTEMNSILTKLTQRRI